MFLGQLFEAAGKQVKVIYPGRFQPFHKGHAQVYQHLCEKFGKDNVYIVTSDKVEMPKSPFSFAEKKAMIGLTGIDTSRVIQDTQPYRAPGLVAQFEAANTILLFAISEKDMAEDPRFQFKPKKDGSPSYFQQFTDLKQCRTLDKHGYMMTVPTFNFTVLGKPANSASQIREQFAGADLATQRKIVTDLFGKFDNNVFNIMKARLEGTTEVAEDDDSDIVDNLVKTTGRTHEEAQRILRAARRRALQMSKKVGSNMSEPAWGNTMAQQIAAQPRGKEVFMKGESVEEASVTNKPPKKGSQRWLTAQKRKEYEKKHPPVEPADQMYGTAKILPKKTEEGRLPQLPTTGADYSKFDTEHLKSMLRPGVMHRNELKFKTLIRRELRRREKEQVTELHVDTHASHIEKRSPMVIPTLMKDVKKGAKMGRAVSKSLEKVRAFNKKSDEPNVFTEETNSAEMARLQRELRKATDPNKKEAIKLNIRKLKGEMELRARDKVAENNNYNPQDTVTFDIPLLIRMLEFAREDAKTDMDLHNVTEKLIAMSADGKTLTMAQYNSIVSPKLQEAINRQLDKRLEEGWGRKTAAGLAAAAAIGAAGIGINKLDQNMQASEAEFVQMIKDPADLERYKDSRKSWLNAMAMQSLGPVYKSMSDMENIRHSGVRDKLKAKYNINEGWGRKTAAGLAAAAAIGAGGCTPAGETSAMCQKIEKKMQGTKMQRAGVIANPTTRNIAAGCNIKKKLTKETIVPGFGEMRPEQVKKEVEGLTAEMLKYARDGNMRAVSEYIKKLQPFVDTARKGEVTESISKALRTAKRNAI
jgi:cytidyltransferase-like protein